MAMSKAVKFDQFLKESYTDTLTPLEDEEIVVAHDEDEEAIEDIDDEFDDNEDEFELEAVPTTQPVHEPEENVATGAEEVVTVDDVDIDDGEADDVTVDTTLGTGDTLDDTSAVIKKAVFLYCGVDNINSQDASYNAAEEIIELMK